VTLVLRSLVLFGACAAAAFLAIVVGGMLSGPTVASGERAVAAIVVADAIVALAAVVLFWRAAAQLGATPRVLATAGFAVAVLLLMAMFAVLTLIAFNR
jgi:hypothetical protein